MGLGVWFCELGVWFCGSGAGVLWEQDEGDRGVEELKAWGTMNSCSSKSLCPLRQEQRRGETEISLSWRDTLCQ